MGIAGECKIHFLFLWVYEMHVDEDDDQFVYRVCLADDEEELMDRMNLADYAALKAAWHPRLLAGAPGGWVSRWSGHGPPWRACLARCAAAACLPLRFGSKG